LLVIASTTEEIAPIVRPVALLAGCLFSLINLFFYKQVVGAILNANASHRGLMAALVLLKLPILVLLLMLLARQASVVVANVVAGSLIFIPGALLAALISPKVDPAEAQRGAEN
jgi:hypothetical protein